MSFLPIHPSHWRCACGEKRRLWRNRDGLRILRCPVDELDDIFRFLRCEYDEPEAEPPLNREELKRLMLAVLPKPKPRRRRVSKEDRALLKQMAVRW